MKTLSLPHELPYREMMAFFYADKVELSMEAERLMQCPVVVRSWFDVFADDAIILPLDLIVFHYTLADWERLCGAIGEFHIPTRSTTLLDEMLMPDVVDGSFEAQYREGRRA